jgi:Fe-S oxidoreductase
MRALRRIVMEVGAGVVPHSLRLIEKNIAAVGNPLGEPPENRVNWAKDLDVKTFTKDMEIMYFPCCYQCYDPDSRKISLATVNILKKVGVDFGIPGNDVVCCGESIRKAGAESLFQRLCRTNINIFKKMGAKKILVTSPHCYHTFKDEYPECGSDFQVIHIVQYLDELIQDGRLKLEGKVEKKTAYHDSCCLGRYQGLYEEPRRVMRNIPGLDIVELEENREYSYCCGGCAGRMWMETKKGERLAEVRIQQAQDAGIDILAISCPYCLANFNDAVISMEEVQGMEIKDVVELVNEALK